MTKPQDLDPSQAYYYNLVTGRVEHGLVSGWTERIGPYATHEDAANAMERAKERNQEWEQQDREWNGEQ